MLSNTKPLEDHLLNKTTLKKRPHFLVKFQYVHFVFKQSKTSLLECIIDQCVDFWLGCLRMDWNELCEIMQVWT